MATTYNGSIGYFSKTHVANQVIFTELEARARLHHDAQKPIWRRNNVLARKHLVADGGGGPGVIHKNPQLALRLMHPGRRVLIKPSPATRTPVLVLHNYVKHERWRNSGR